MASQDEPWFLKSKKPVALPKHQALDFSDKDFDAFVKSTVIVGDTSSSAAVDAKSSTVKGDVLTETTEESVTNVLTPPSTTQDVREVLNSMDINTSQDEQSESEDESVVDMENKMLTENSDVAYRSTKNALVDLFAELEDVVSGPRLIELLNLAWDCDPDVTLKIMFNARSIHLGKSSRHTFYRCAGWLFQKHPATLITNLRWLSRPVIQKKLEKEEGEHSEKAVFVEVAEVDENDPAHYDVRNGVSHGYWKDLVNILALAVNGKLDPLANPKDILNVHQEKDDGVSRVTQKQAKEKRRETSVSRHKTAVEKFENDANYRALHLTVARVFAEQLKTDLELLRGGEPRTKRNISLCAKWAPSAGRFHDKHTYITSTIAEILAHSSTPGDASKDREHFIRHAREGYRKDVAALRKALEVVELDISANTFENIKYDRVPSIAMQNYTPIFVKKDEKRFDEYITKVAEGSANISGAVLSPSALIRTVQGGSSSKTSRGKYKNEMVENKIAEMKAKVADGQWKTLVQRIRDSGTLDNSIAVCDVSGSMSNPQFKDGTCPMDSAIGLSLLVAEVCKPPFGGSFITFSTTPSIQSVDLKASLSQKVNDMQRADWGMSTDFVAVFEKVILPMAVKDKIKPEDMVKRVFVFSDMQFDQAVWKEYQYNDDGTVKEDTAEDKGWSTSYERVQTAYRAAGYEMPELVFWNLAGGRAGVTGYGDPTAPKPVTADMEGTSLVSGYSQGMLKVFLDGGGFECPEDEDEDMMEVVKGEDGEEVDVQEHKRRRNDPFDTVRKAISHQAYSMLTVVD
ncbi:hypothetical protein PspLS_05897 [Pyricularia sp. CBS 133598]|nr:hypothetical protein PspLS_05897 [Pyricularia sp. CBS 133598]